MVGATQRVDLGNERIRTLLCRCLEGRQAATIDELVRDIGIDKQVVARELGRLAEMGVVNVLRPISCPANTGGLETGRRGRCGEYFRLIQETDDDYLWEQEIDVRLPSSRTFQVREKKGGVERQVKEQTLKTERQQAPAFSFTF